MIINGGVQLENKKLLSNFRVLDLVQIALMAAITYIATAVINVPSHMGVVHLGDTIVFVSAILLGRKKGALSSAIGMSLFDLLSPYAIWAPFTFVIKGVMAFIAASVAYRGDFEGNNIWNNLLGFALGSVWMVGAYYTGGVIISYFCFGMPLNQSLIKSSLDIPGNIVQVTAGTILALPLAKMLKKSIKIH
jgi:uncharacterized membrane protein